MIPAFRLKLEIEGADAAVEDLLAIAARGYEAKPVLKVIQELMRTGAEAQFVTEGERTGWRWELDKPDTIAKKLRALHEHVHGPPANAAVGA